MNIGNTQQNLGFSAATTIFVPQKRQVKTLLSQNAAVKKQFPGSEVSYAYLPKTRDLPTGRRILAIYTQGVSGAAEQAFQKVRDLSRKISGGLVENSNADSRNMAKDVFQDLKAIAIRVVTMPDIRRKS